MLLLFILFLSLTFTALPCKTIGQFCKSDYCKSGTSFDRISGKCVENVENCAYLGFDVDAHKDCINNNNGKVLCDFKLKKCVENVKYCVDDGYCRFNIDGKTSCFYYFALIDQGLSVEGKNVCIFPEDKYPEGYVPSGNVESYSYDDPESIATYNLVMKARNK